MRQFGKSGRQTTFAGVALLAAVVAAGSIGIPQALAGWGIQAKPPAWVKDASRATLPTSKIAGTLSGSPFTVKRVVWKKQMAMDFSDAPLEIMALEVGGTSAKPHAFAMPAIDMKDIPPAARAELAKTLKKTDPKALTFVVTISVRKGESVAGKEFVHGPKDGLGIPDHATPGKPILLGMEARLSETDTVTVGYTLRLKFGPKRGSVQPGTLYLCLTDDKKSVVAGTFEAVVK